ncbi:hypothetical protein SAMN04489722_103207 [Algibacter lectus]|uniref:hypothetical protein n=1 Tax=Algibacter lectus TaxID=221126 RepID=UPI0008EE8411|nr:hypothetical protein [Algibacter lectus]SFC70008.1 hypothetical protein SAMN04489722_103207 [Algibacter lectus]
MEALKLKIFDVLTEKIAVSQFENWLYSSEYINQKIKADSLFFNIININYREAKSIKELKEITASIFTDEELLVVKLLQNCIKIKNAEASKNIKKSVVGIISDFDYYTELNPFWEFYDVYNSYEYFEDEYTSEKDIDIKLKGIAISVITKFESAKSIEESIELLKQIEENSTEQKNNLNSTDSSLKNTVNEKEYTFIQKIFAFFKKI